MARPIRRIRATPEPPVVTTTMTAADAVALWNRAYPATYLVNYWPGIRSATVPSLVGQTLGPARIMGGTAVVPVSGVRPERHTDHIALTHIEVIS